jgi:hypothetical protein
VTTTAKKNEPHYPTIEELATLSEKELARRFAEALPVDGWSKTKKWGVAAWAERKRQEKQREKERAALPVETPIPPALRSTVAISSVAGATELLERGERFAARG